MVDTSAITRGYLVAFTDESKMQTYLDKTSRPRSAKTFDGQRLPLAQPVVSAGGGASLLGSDRVGLMTCATVTQPTHQAYLYEDKACGGNHLVALWSETEKNLGTYNWSNKISSMIIGDCIANLRVWDLTGAGDNGGANRNFGNSSAHTTYSSIQFGGSENWSDRISSYKTDLAGGSTCT